MAPDRRFEDQLASQAAMEFLIAADRAIDAWPDDLRGGAFAVPADLTNGCSDFGPGEPSGADHLLARLDIVRLSPRDAETLLHGANGSGLVADDALDHLPGLGGGTRSRLGVLPVSPPEPENRIDPFHPPCAAN